MASLGSLVIELAANTARLSGDLGKAVHMAESAAGKFQKAFAFVGIGVGGGLFGEVIRQSIEFGDQIQKAAARAGTSASAMSKLAAAAGQVDVDIDSLSKGFKELQVSISKAASGSDGQARLFDALGVSVQSLRAMRPEEQLAVIADQLSKVADPTDRARVGAELFGRTYLALVPILERGGSGIRDLVREQERLGNTFSDAQIARLADADEAIKRMKSSWTGLARTLTADVAPAITAVLNKLSSMRAPENLESLRSRLASIEGGYDEPAKAALRAQIAKLEAEQRNNQRSHLRGPAGPSEIDMSALSGNSDDAAKAAQAAADALKREGDALTNSLLTPLGKYRDAVADADRLLAAHVITTETWAAAIVKAGEDLQKSAGDVNDYVAALQNMTDDLTTQFEEFANQMLDSVDASLESIPDEIDAALEQTQDAFSTFAEQAARNMQDAFARFLFDPFKGGLQGMLQSFEQTIRQMVAQAIAADLFKRLGSWASGAAGSGGVMGAVASVVKVMLPPGKAAGGPVWAGRPYMVGERGPELFMPGRSGTIVPNGVMRGGAMTVVNHFAFNGNAAPDRRTQMQIAAQVRRSVAMAGRNT